MNDKDISWKKIPCKCDKSDIEKCFPIFKDCIHCYCKNCEDSMPRQSFKNNWTDKKGKKQTRIITEITIDRSEDGYNSIRGWYY